VLDFVANKNNGTVALMWKTGMDNHIVKYVIERSINGLDFTTVGEERNVRGGYVNVYNAIDATPNMGMNWYRIQIIDIRGQVTYTSTKVVNFAKGEIFSLYPNPAMSRSVLSIGAAYIGKPLTVKVLDMTGKVVISQSVNQASNSEVLQVAALAVGQYIVTVISENQILYKNNLIVAR
jgi:hypothetical protein